MKHSGTQRLETERLVLRRFVNEDGFVVPEQLFAQQTMGLRHAFNPPYPNYGTNFIIP